MGDNYPFANKGVTGTTTNAYVAALTLYNGMGAVIQLKSTTTTMFYKIDAYLTSDGTPLAYPTKTETTTVADTALLDTNQNFPFYKMVVSVKQNSGAGTYQIDALQY